MIMSFLSHSILLYCPIQEEGGPISMIINSIINLILLYFLTFEC